MVGVVELQRKPLREVVQRRVGQVIHDVHDVLQRARHEEVLLKQSKSLTRLGSSLG